MCAFFSTMAVAALSLAATAQAQSTGGCNVVVHSGGDSYSKDAYIKRGFDLAIYLCDGDYHQPDELTTYAEEWVGDTAVAYARAFVHTIIDCQVTGNGDASVYLSGHAEDQAEAAATAILEGYASASTCNGCSAYANVFIESTKKLFVKVAASHYDEVHLYADGGFDSVYRETLVEDIKEEIVEAYVSYVIDLYASMTGGNGQDSSEYCYVSVDACASTGESNCCSWYGDGSTSSYAEDAFAEAVIKIPHDDINCKKVGDDTYHAFSSAIASAFASSFASVYAYCNNNNPDGNACVWGGVDASSFAHAAAQATARAWIAESYCGCGPGQDIVVKAFEHVYADAYSYISAEVCVTGQASADVNLFVSAYEENFGKATAEAFASIWQDHYGCEVTDLSVTACAGEAENDAPCYLQYYESVKHCKGDDYHCVKVNDNRAVCKPTSYVPPGHWDGEILECPDHE